MSAAAGGNFLTVSAQFVCKQPKHEEGSIYTVLVLLIPGYY